MHGTTPRLVALAAVAMVSLAACGQGLPTTTEDHTPRTLRLAHVHSQTDTAFYHYFATHFAENVSRESDGRLQVDVYHGAQLGAERDVVEGLQIGSVDAAIVGSFILGNFDRQLQVFDLPFLFADYDTAQDVLRSDFMIPIESGLAEKGLVPLAWGQGAFRNVMTTRHKVEAVNDLAGLKIRLPESPIYLASFEAMNASPTPMAFSEVFTALQQGTIDGVENPVQGLYDQRYYEAASYVAETRHFFSPAPLLMSRATWEDLTEADQDVLRRSAQDAADAEWGFVVEQEEIYFSKLASEGVDVTRHLDLQPFRDATAPVYEQAREDIGADLVDEAVRRAQS